MSDKSTKNSPKELLNEIKELERRYTLNADFYLQQLKDLHGSMLRTLQEVRLERKQMQGTVARLGTIEALLNKYYSSQREEEESWKW